MIRSLHIENYVLIDSLDVSFPEGLVIITGQTGAGKSILLGAMSLLLGVKADAGHISDKADTCVVEAEFDAGSDPGIKEILEANDIDWDGENIIVRRVINRSGRSRSFINDIPVQGAVLSSLGGHLVDIHSQHSSLLLMDRKYQLSVLDSFAGLDDTVARCREEWKALVAKEKELEYLKEKARRLSEDYEYEASRYRGLVEAGLKENEIDELEEEQKVLSNAEEIKTILAQVASKRPDADVKETARAISKLEKYVPAISELAGRLESVRIELADIFDEIETRYERTEVSEERLVQVEDRLSLLYGLLKKHNCSTVGELMQIRDRLGDSLSISGSMDDRIADLEAEVSEVRKVYESTCSGLRAARVKAAGKFSAAVCGSLEYLELERAVFDVQVLDSQPGPSGTDSVLFRFSATGSNPVEVSRCASGGEMSRIMLCLKAMMAGLSGAPALVFDEIDTGVSGSVADKMGEMICSLGQSMQVMAITHLPQVAAKGKAHFVVTKSVGTDGSFVSTLSKVEGNDRVMEIARLLSGSKITPQAVANAESLLNGN